MASVIDATSFVIQGKTISTVVDPNAPLERDIRKALEQSGIDGGDAGLWKARTSEGRLLDNGRSLSGQGLGKSDKIFLDKGPGRGGWPSRS